eukprot:CAMPEP_0170537556 /NCGR_PEP_ID=MMETSP0209-20121228/102787_1 /TAXON_ID=665100 ORGANISM="Litonotus pictus, Strain P1" /NCGR_SAMPLE_ID=MMETSP0209 /ASSEMBLY_ACC=CAM_ASM_000301 /LENGTH=113 /DNA_ID=CAMNT_0010839079 /DNA_START=887 /DNA_END=1225 /DNA_ORIENTATION=-
MSYFNIPSNQRNLFFNRLEEDCRKIRLIDTELLAIPPSYNHVNYSDEDMDLKDWANNTNSPNVNENSTTNAKKQKNRRKKQNKKTKMTNLIEKEELDNFKKMLEKSSVPKAFV